MPTDVAVLPNVYIQGNLTVNGMKPAYTRDELAQQDNAVYGIPHTEWRVFDAMSVPLPGDGQTEAGTIQANYYWDPNSADDSFFVAGRAYRVLGITARVEVVGTDGGAVTAAIKKAASGTDIASGTALHTGTANLKGTVDTNQTLSLSATSTDLDIAAGTCIGIDFTGTLTSARGCVSVLLAPSASADDLRIVGGTFGSASPSLQTGDVKTTTVTKRARCQVVLPPEYVAGQSVTIRVHAGMITTAADGSATVDFEVYKSNQEAGIGSDLVSTNATSINSTSYADKDFILSASTLSPGDTLDIRMSVAVVDSATVTAVIASVGAVSLLLDVKG